MISAILGKRPYWGAFFCLLVLPWCVPFYFGPSPSIPSNLFSAICACLIWAGLYHEGPEQSTRAIVAAWLTAACVCAVMGFLQFFSVAEPLAPWISHANQGEAFANLRQRNQFATLMNIGVAALLFLPQIGRRRYIAFVLAVLLGAANAASASRTGLLEVIALVSLVFYWRRSRTNFFEVVSIQCLAAVVGGYLFFALVLPSVLVEQHASGIVARFGNQGDACSSRMVLWSNVFHLIIQKPLLGWGWGELDYAHFITRYPGERFCEILDNAHNLPLHLAVELGLPAAIFFCSSVGWLIWRAQPWAETRPTRQLAWAILVMVGLHSLLEYPLWYGPFQLSAALCVWMLWVTPRPGELKHSQTAMYSVFVNWVAVGLLTVCAYVAWDYWRISQIYLRPEQRSATYRNDTLSKVQDSWLFKNQVKFAELAITDLTPENADYIYTSALELLHFSPEPRVVKKLVESATMLGRDAEAIYYSQRYTAAFGRQYKQ